MRISDWSSDVCSSDLASAKINGFHFSTVQKIIPKENFLSQGLQHLITIFQRGTEVEITVMTGFLAKRDMNVSACHATKRSKERSVEKGGVSTCRTRWAPVHEKKKRAQITDTII